MTAWILAALGALLFLWAFVRYRAERARARDLERQCARWAVLVERWETGSREAARRIQGAVADFTAAETRGRAS